MGSSSSRSIRVFAGFALALGPEAPAIAIFDLFGGKACGFDLGWEKVDEDTPTRSYSSGPKITPPKKDQFIINNLWPGTWTVVVYEKGEMVTSETVEIQGLETKEVQFSKKHRDSHK